VRVAVLGAAGTIGPAIVRDLATADEVESILLLDLDGPRAAEVADRHGLGKASARPADAREDLASALAGPDVLVNSASYRINLDAMHACLEAGCHYLDLGGLYHLTGEQLELGPAFESADLLAILGIGSSPGKTNLMAAKLVAELGAGPRRIDVLAAGRDPEPPPGFSAPYALQTLIDEVTMRPVILRDGQPVEIDPLTGGGEVDFGGPIGRADTIHTLHSELRTFGESFGCREASFRLALAPALLERLRDLAGATQGEVAVAAREAQPPSSRTVAVHIVEVRGETTRGRMRCVTAAHEDWGLGGGIVSTASPATAAVRLLAGGRIDARGALPPERCLDPDEVFAELETRGCRFSLEVSGQVPA
jgi:saccharopine dehydrogenase (NAD+, L-lysine-forming)